MSDNILDLRKTSSRSEQVSSEIKPILSGGEVPVSTSTTEKSVLADRNSSDEVGISRKPSLDKLFAKEMSRKEFLLTIGIGLTSLLGLSSVLTLLGEKPRQTELTQNSYSSGPYGGYKQPKS